MIRPEHANVLIALGFKPLDDFYLSVSSDGSARLDWLASAEQPSDTTLDAYLSDHENLPSGITFSEWKASIDNVPHSITRTQGRLALHRAGLLSAVEAVVAAANVETQIFYDSANWRRANPLIDSLGNAIGLSKSQIDQLFIAAGNID
jgi:hypothetical protein